MRRKGEEWERPRKLTSQIDFSSEKERGIYLQDTLEMEARHTLFVVRSMTTKPHCTVAVASLLL
jgi:hypothetical protein